MSDDYDKTVGFEQLWKDWFSMYPPLDTMTWEEREKFKDFARKIYLLTRRGERSSRSW